jgi:hypothetical protein
MQLRLLVKTISKSTNRFNGESAGSRRSEIV